MQRWLAEGRVVHVAQVVETRGFSSASRPPRWPGPTATRSARCCRSSTPISSPPAARSTATSSRSPSATPTAIAAGSVVRRRGERPRPTGHRLPAGHVGPAGAAASRCACSPRSSAARRHRPRPSARRPFATPPSAPARRTCPRLFARGFERVQLLSPTTPRCSSSPSGRPTTLVVVGDGSIAERAGRRRASCSAGPSLVSNEAGAVGSADGSPKRRRRRAQPRPRRRRPGARRRAGRPGRLRRRARLAAHPGCARREWLTAHGVDDAHQARIHGPAGLDIDAHTPGRDRGVDRRRDPGQPLAVVRRLAARPRRPGAHRRRAAPRRRATTCRAPSSRSEPSATESLRAACERDASRRRKAASRSASSAPAATQASSVQPAAGSRCSQPGGHWFAPSSRSGNAHSRSSAVTWARPNERTPGVSITQPSSSGSGSAIADDDVCRPLPIALTRRSRGRRTGRAR